MIGETYMPSTWLALKTAQLYYLENMSQKEIASILNISNVTVSRMLQRAKDLGLSLIHIYLQQQDPQQCLESDGIHGSGRIPLPDTSWQHPFPLCTQQNYAAWLIKVFWESLMAVSYTHLIFP